MQHKFTQWFFTTTLFFSVTGVKADIIWSDISLAYLYGGAYLNPFSSKTGHGQVFTLEHAGSYNFGKSFFFLDRFNTLDEGANQDDTYAELGVDLSLSWMTGLAMQHSLIKDVYLSTQWENSNPQNATNTDNLLFGVGVAWDIQGFVFFDTRVYYRVNEHDRSNYQLTASWKVPFTISQMTFVFDGFFDATTPTETINGHTDIASMFHMSPQLKLDVGDFFQRPDKFYVGIEYDYWLNKYGQKGQDQSAPQLLMQVHF